MKFLYFISFFCISLFSQSSISTENLDYIKWLKSEKFSNNLIEKTEHARSRIEAMISRLRAMETRS